MKKYDEENMTFVLNSNDDFYDMVYANKENPVRVDIYGKLDKNHLSKKIGYAELEYNDWYTLDAYSYSDGQDSGGTLNRYEEFMESLIIKLEKENKFVFFD